MTKTNSIPVKSTVDESYKRSLELFHKLLTEKGFTASLQETANYCRIWARDGVLEGLPHFEAISI